VSDTNFAQCVRNIRAFLRGENCLQIVLKEEAEPSADKYTKWKDSQSREGAAYALIFASCTPEIQENISGLDESADMWTKLREKLVTSASRAGQTMLPRQFSQSKPDPSQPIQSISPNCGNFEEGWQVPTKQYLMKPFARTVFHTAYLVQ